MKYVMFKQTLKHGSSRLVPIIFPEHGVHSDISKAIKSMPGFEDAVPVSAGECDVDVGATFGSSETLKMEAAETDAEVINMYDYFHGLVED